MDFTLEPFRLVVNTCMLTKNEATTKNRAFRMNRAKKVYELVEDLK